MTREMKNSGVQWIGNIPSNWGVFPVYKFYHDRIFLNLDYEYQRAFKFNYGTLKYKDEQGDLEYYRDTYIKYSKVKKNDIVINGLNLNYDFISQRVAITPEDGIITSAYIVMRPYDDIVHNYFCYVFKAMDNMKLFHGMGKGIRLTLSFDELKRQKICLPPLSEQKAIADFLDEKCGEIDGLLADLDTEVKTLAEYKKSLIAETVTRGLNPNVPMKQSGIPWADTIPAHWKVIANKYIMRKKKEIVPVYSGQDIISLSMNGVIVRDLDAGGKMPTSFNGYQQIYPGNLLMCLFDIDVTPRCIGLIKNKGLTSPAYSQFEMIDDTYAPYYYYFYLKMDNTKELVHLSKNMRHSLNEEQFGMIKTIQPPMEEQVAIADFLDTKCAAIDQAITDKTTQIETLKAYKASLIYEYVTGKKQVAL